MDYVIDFRRILFYNDWELRRWNKTMVKKKTSTMERIKKISIWLMLIATIGSLVAGTAVVVLSFLQ